MKLSEAAKVRLKQYIQDLENLLKDKELYVPAEHCKFFILANISSSEDGASPIEQDEIQSKVESDQGGTVVFEKRSESFYVHLINANNDYVRHQISRKHKDFLSNNFQKANAGEYHEIKNSQLIATLKGIATLDAFTISQIQAAIFIAKTLSEAWDLTFEASLLKNKADFLSAYNIINGGDGSWSVAIANKVGIAFAQLTEALFLDFKNNFYQYVLGIPQNADKVTVVKFSFAYKKPTEIIDSAIRQMQGIRAFFEFLTKENYFQKVGVLLKNIRDKFDPIFEEEKFDETALSQLLSKALEAILGYPSSYIEIRQLQAETGLYNPPKLPTIQENVTVFPRRFGGVPFESFIADVVAKLLHQRSIDLTQMIQEQIVKSIDESQIQKVMQCLDDFAKKVKKYSNEDNHALTKKTILTELNEALTVIKLHMASVSTITSILQSHHYATIVEKESVYYKMPQEMDKSAVVKDFKEALLAYISLFPEHCPKNQWQQELSDSKEPFVWYKDHKGEINKFLKAPTECIYDALIFINKAIQDHFNFVQSGNYSMGETGDMLQDLFAEMLELFSQCQVKHDPTILLLFTKLMANNAAKNTIESMKKEAKPEQESRYSSASPALFSEQQNTKEEEDELSVIPTFGSQKQE